MRRHPKHLTGAMVTCAVGLAAARPALATPPAEEFPRDWFWHQTEEQWQKHAELLGEDMPTLDLSGWENETIDLETDLKGKVVVVDFWATWCGPCLASIPHNNEIYEKYKDDGLVFVGVCGSSRGQERMSEVVSGRNIEYPVARDADLKSAEAWRVMWWPTYAVVDRAGKVRAVGLKPDYVDDVVDVLIKEEAPEGTAATIPAGWLESNPHRDTLKSMEGKTAPALAVKDWLNADPATLEDMKGKVVLLDFWATWCGPCLASVPHNNELYAKYKDQGLVLLGVCHPQGVEKMDATVKEHGIEYPVVADPDGATIEAYRVNSFPDYYFIDRAGNLRVADCANGKVEDVIKLLLAEKAPAAKPSRPGAP